MTATVVAFAARPTNGLTRGQVKYLREEAASCRDLAIRFAKIVNGQAERFERIACAPFMTLDDFHYIYRRIGTMNHPHFDSLK